jgi:hypothetical protein
MNPVLEIKRTGLLWIGTRFYPTVEDFLVEARDQGISRRLPLDHIPRGFKAGETCVFLGHRHALRVVLDEGEDMIPGIVAIWRPQRIEKVVEEDITDEEIEALAKRGIEPVIVRPVDGTLELVDPEEDAPAREEAS